MLTEKSVMSFNQDRFGQSGTIKIAFAPHCFSLCTTREKPSKGGLIHRGSDQSSPQASS